VSGVSRHALINPGCFSSLYILEPGFAYILNSYRNIFQYFSIPTKEGPSVSRQAKIPAQQVVGGTLGAQISPSVYIILDLLISVAYLGVFDIRGMELPKLGAFTQQNS
jgi:hypothetical protein